MKKIQILGLFIITVSVLVTGCKKPYDYDKEVAASVSTPEKIAASINGTWRMNSAVEIDEKSLVKESMDIADFLTSDMGAVPNITFNTTDNTFTVDTNGLVQNFFKVDHGKWNFDDARYPSKVILTDIDNNPILDVVIGKNLLSPNPQLDFVDGVKCGAEMAISYSVSFIKQN
jgi:hypothetical protein